MAKKLRVGLIGAGGIAQSHMRGWKENQDAEVVAICDIKRKAREDTAKRWDVAKNALFGDYEKMLEKVELDVVDVCTPNAYHKAPAIAGFEAYLKKQHYDKWLWLWSQNLKLMMKLVQEGRASRPGGNENLSRSFPNS